MIKNKCKIKFSALILAIVFVFILSACENKREPITPQQPEEEKPLVYKHVAIIGVDGAGTFFNQTDTPNMDKIFANGATTYTATAEIPTISAQNWGSILHGVACDIHGFTNDIVSETSIDSSYPYPSVFKALRQSIPNAEMCSVVKWDPINIGLIEWDIGVHLYNCEEDSEVRDMTVRMINDYCPELLFVQFDSVDGTGHSVGYGSPEYLERITEIDGYIGDIYRAYDDLGVLSETLFIVTADHGGTNFKFDGIEYHDHGGTTPEEVTIFIGIVGESVANIDLGTIRNRDVAAIAAAALNIEKPDVWTSEVPANLFTDRQ